VLVISEGKTTSKRPSVKRVRFALSSIRSSAASIFAITWTSFQMIYNSDIILFLLCLFLSLADSSHYCSNDWKRESTTRPNIQMHASHDTTFLFLVGVSDIGDWLCQVPLCFHLATQVRWFQNARVCDIVRVIFILCSVR
jgi:hypothetical protein